MKLPRYPTSLQVMVCAMVLSCARLPSTIGAQEPARPAAPVPPILPAAGSGRDEVRASHILVGTKEEADAARKEIIAAGGDRKAFAAVARRLSKDVTTKVLGGDVSWFRQGSGMDKAFTDVTYSLKVGEMSEPVQTPFGWHLIFLTERRELGTGKPQEGPGQPPPQQPPPPPQPQPTPQPQPPQPQPPAGPNALVPTPPPGQDTATPVVTQPVPPAPPVEAKRSNRTDQMSFRLSLETVASQRAGAQQFTLPPEQAVEVNLVLKNESSREQKFFAREVLPLGLKLTALGEIAPMPGDFSAVPEPASFFANLKPYELMGIEVSLNDFWKGLTPRRYGVTWDMNTFMANLEARFPKAKDLPDYAPLGEAMKKRFPLTTDVVTRDASPRIAYQRNRPLPVSIFEPIRADAKYYAHIKLQGSEEPITIELHTKEQYPSVRHFAALVNEGFYDNLDFFEVEEGDYVLGGCPTSTGTGAPSSMLPTMRNEGKLEHKRGTVSFVSRNTRAKGPVRGGQVGSIFVVCLKPHPEWNDEHVPFGEVISGLEQLEKQGRKTFKEVTILTEAQMKTRAADTIAKPAAVTGNPEALIKTSKGNLTVEIFEDVARNTASNFITLAGEKFYDKLSKGEGKQKFFLMKDEAGKPLLLQTGSPTNEPDGGPQYNIPGEVNARKHVKGALVMCIAYDETNKIYIPDSAGSQFFICLQDIPYYDFLKTFTIFGQVTGGMDILDKLGEGDTVDSIEITKKKPHPYNVRKVTSP